MLSILAAFFRNPALFLKLASAVAAIAKAIAAYEEKAEQRKFASDFTAGWNDAMETGDPKFLHAVIDAHPAFRVRQ